MTGVQSLVSKSPAQALGELHLASERFSEDDAGAADEAEDFIFRRRPALVARVAAYQTDLIEDKYL